ncbi:MAG: tetratricopeptide repeat protein [Verrucomicrobia bacterium]|nr:tetratricopeptide repeat protein [Verrucomicrobiota bacterium]
MSGGFKFSMAEKRKEQPQPGNKQDTYQKLDEAYAESNLEDQLIVYWNRHKNQVLIGLLVAVVLVLGIQLSKWWSQKSVTDRGEAYAAATDDSQKEAFADNNSSSELGGVAYLELADKAYSDGNFVNAISLYEKAFKAFDLVTFKQRSHLGLALSRLQSGNATVAIKDLESISAKVDYPEVARAEALFHLSILDWENGSFESMLQRHEQIEEFSNAGNWPRKVFELQNSVPELKMLVLAKATDGLSVENLQVIPAN